MRFLGSIQPLNRKRHGAVLSTVIVCSLLVAVDHAEADGRCAQFGTPSYTATRTALVGETTVVSNVFIQDRLSREEKSNPEGVVVEVSINTPTERIIFSPVKKEGVRIPAPPPMPKDPKRDRTREEPNGANVDMIFEVNRGGAWVEVLRITCAKDGTAVGSRGTIFLRDKQSFFAFRQTNIQIQPLDPGLFTAPDDVKIADIKPPQGPPPGGAQKPK